MIYTKLTKTALRICFDTHRDQVDKSGLPYVFHPFHLAEQMPTEEAVAVALLHDVAEDTDITLQDLETMGMPPAVLEALALLTHRKEEPYMDYVARVKGNPLARQVKLADLRHNADLSRLESPDAAAYARAEKYRAAIALLEA